MTSAKSIDWSATAAWIALVVAIVSPVITAIISNHHQAKMKHLEIIEKRGLDVIENYLAITSREILTTGISDSYRKSYTQIFLYAPSSLHPAIEELNTLIYNPVDGMSPDKEKCTTLLIKISKALKYDKM